MTRNPGTESQRLRMQGVHKRFGATRALRGVDLVVQPGEIHALIGENGAGKSTLMKVLSGALSADSGRIELDGLPFEAPDPLEARRQGVVMIYQELNLAPDLSIEENIMLGAELARFGWLNRNGNRARALEVLGELDYGHLDVNMQVRAASIAERQVVEIARALLFDTRLVVMDEPTSSLTRADVERLFAVIRRLSQRGVSVVYISHFLEECSEIADAYTVLRDGETAGTGTMAGTKESDLVRLMVGRSIDALYPENNSIAGSPVLTLREMRGDPKPRHVDLTLHEGEIFGVAGLVGSGRTETLRTLFGLDERAGGSIEVYGTPSPDFSPSQRLGQGIGLLSEDRKGEGLMLNLSLADNLTLSNLRPLSKAGLVRRSAQHEQSSRWIDRLSIRTRGPFQAVGELSGGNRQKVAFGRLLYHDARVLLLDEPTRGIDVGSKAELYRIMVELARAGTSILFVSSYLPELLAMCNTIGVMSRGRMVAVRPASEWTEESIMSAALSGVASSPAA